MSLTNEYPWYQLVEGEALEQGDILYNCPVLVPGPELLFPIRDGDNFPVDVKLFDVVVMTQSCDLENDKVHDVILCPHWDLRKATEVDPALASKSAAFEIKSGRRPRYTLLSSSSLITPSMSVRIVDCGKIFCLPKQFVQALAARQTPRLRLRSPYREHLSQAFARFFMRVGLPQDVQLP